MRLQYDEVLKWFMQEFESRVVQRAGNESRM